MKTIILIILAMLSFGVATTFGQAKNAEVSNGKKDQTNLYNDLYISYGTGTVFYFIDNQGFNATSMTGTFLAGFSRSLNHVIAVGFQVSYTRISRGGDNYYYGYPNPPTTTNTLTDNLWQGMANIRFRYLNKPSFCMYSGVGMGVTMDYYSKNTESVTTTGQDLFPAAQLTLLGFRVGRALSVFGEFGIGTNSVINAGVSYKIGD